MTEIFNDIEQLVTLALSEDIVTGDITSNLTILDNPDAKFNIIAKEDCILCGCEFALNSFIKIDPEINIKFHYTDGVLVKKSQIIASGQGNAKNILKSERVALNFLQYFSGISTITNQYVKLVKPYNVQILDTRKIIPLYRKFAKYAVMMGGGKNHRFSLADQILIKDNHIIAAKGIANALNSCKKATVKKEIECETLEQISDALLYKPDIIMLDNMDLTTIKQAVKLIANQCLIEISGNVNLENVVSLAKTGIDYISVGKITHSVTAVDISLDLKL
jgi:nicotinate-nucleotide pyrophosphorylase (carboxylating)